MPQGFSPLPILMAAMSRPTFAKGAVQYNTLDAAEGGYRTLVWWIRVTTGYPMGNRVSFEIWIGSTDINRLAIRLDSIGFDPMRRNAIGFSIGLDWDGMGWGR